MRDRLESLAWVRRGRAEYEARLDTPPGRLFLAWREVRLRDRALTLAGQAFIALIPLSIVVTGVLGSSGGAAVGRWLVDRFSLEGSSATAVLTLFARPPEPTSGMSFLSLAILLVSVNGFARALQRAFEAAWGLPGTGRGAPCAGRWAPGCWC